MHIARLCARMTQSSVERESWNESCKKIFYANVLAIPHTNTHGLASLPRTHAQAHTQAQATSTNEAVL